MIVYLFMISTSFGQEEDFCATPPKTLADHPRVYSKSTDIGVFNSFEPKTFNIFYWKINMDDGSYPAGYPLAQETVLESVALINETFTDLNICFNLIGMGEINSTEQHTGSSLISIHNYAVSEGLARQDAFNVYVPQTLGAGAGQGRYKRTHMAVADYAVLGNAIVHELGHNFNLTHTFENDNWRPHPINCERVTRIISDPEYNANTEGDEVTDTNAVPNFFREQHNHFANAVEQANLGYNWGQASQIPLMANGFNTLPDATAIEQALLDYGFTQAEITHLRFNAAVSFAYTDIENCIYTPDSRINDTNSPFFKDCGGSPYQVLQSDTTNTMSYFHSSCRNTFTMGQRIRAHESIIEDYWGEFTPALSLTDADLYIQDTTTDIGQEPNIHTNVFWVSEDIWVRNQNDGLTVQEHENPEYNANSSNYLYVRVNNKTCTTTPNGLARLKLYWAKANTALSWPLHWEGNLTVIDANGIEVLMGDAIGEVSIPVIGNGESTILEFEWDDMPNPEDYMDINNDNPWHFCLLARIESLVDPMSFPEANFITDNVKNNNNIAWKNVTIVDIIPGITSNPGGVVAVGNFFNQDKAFTLEFYKEPNEVGKAIYNEAEVSITLDAILYNAWDSGGKEEENFKSTAQSQKIIVEDDHAFIKNLNLAANEIGTLSLNFNFLTKELTNKSKYTYHLVQRDAITNKVIGGETFEVRKPSRAIFDADAGEDKEIEKNESITISAGEINETATYNWYNPEGVLIHTGTDLTVTAAMTQTYKLEVVSNLDGYKDYDEIEVAVKPNRIISLTPNPVSTVLTIDYSIEGVTSAYIEVLNQNTATSNNYILNPSSTSTAIDLSTYPLGLYTILLNCDGESIDSKNLAKQ